MKPVNTIVKILTALAAVAGAVYIVATYGEKIVEWAKQIWSKMPKCPCCDDEDIEVEVVTDLDTEEPAAEEIPVEETTAEEPAPEVVVTENEPVAAEEDFAE